MLKKLLKISSQKNDVKDKNQQIQTENETNSQTSQTKNTFENVHEKRSKNELKSTNSIKDSHLFLNIELLQSEVEEQKTPQSSTELISFIERIVIFVLVKIKNDEFDFIKSAFHRFTTQLQNLSDAKINKMTSKIDTTKEAQILQTLNKLGNTLVAKIQNKNSKFIQTLGNLKVILSKSSSLNKYIHFLKSPNFQSSSKPKNIHYELLINPKRYASNFHRIMETKCGAISNTNFDEIKLNIKSSLFLATFLKIKSTTYDFEKYLKYLKIINNADMRKQVPNAGTADIKTLNREQAISLKHQLLQTNSFKPTDEISALDYYNITGDSKSAKLLLFLDVVNLLSSKNEESAILIQNVS